MKAFVLGAGLGTRLHPLTEWLPKPMVPVYHRPLISYAFDHLRALDAIDGFVVNTHHYPEAYTAAFSDGHYEGLPIGFRNEPVLLETAGGIANVADLLGNERFVVYNGDILADIPLEPLLKHHAEAKNEVTLLLRTEGPGLHIGMDHATNRLADIREMLGNSVDAYYQFTGIYVVEPAFLQRLTPGKKESVIPIFLDMIKESAALGGWVEDAGHWWDLGDEATYREVHQSIPSSGFPSYAPAPPWIAQHPTAKVSSNAKVEGCILGPGCQIADHAQLKNAVLWPGAVVGPNETVADAVVRGDRATHYQHFFP